MEHKQQLIDFKDLVGSVRGEGLERLTAYLGERLGLNAVWTGRGPDGGKDLSFTELHTGPISRRAIKWVVSCKDKAASGEAVTEKDLPSVADKVKQHQSDGFLLVTTTTIGVAAKALLDGQDISNGGEILTRVWDASDLRMMLLKAENQDLLKQFLPESYKRVKQFGSLEEAISAFKHEIPEAAFVQIIALVRSFSVDESENADLTGPSVWPYDIEPANTIDTIISFLLNEHDVVKAVQATEDLDYDAFVAFVKKITLLYPNEGFEYLTTLIRTSIDPDVVFNAFQLLSDRYELSNSESIDLATYLDSESISLIYEDEIVYFVQDEVTKNPASYRIDSAFNMLPGLTALEQIGYVRVTALKVWTEDNRIQFSGSLEIDAILSHGEDATTSLEVEGDFNGYFDEDGIYLESVRIRVSQLENEDPDY